MQRLVRLRLMTLNGLESVKGEHLEDASQNLTIIKENSYSIASQESLRNICRTRGVSWQIQSTCVSSTDLKLSPSFPAPNSSTKIILGIESRVSQCIVFFLILNTILSARCLWLFTPKFERVALASSRARGWS